MHARDHLPGAPIVAFLSDMSSPATPETLARPPLLHVPSQVVGDRIVVRPFRRGDGAELFAAIDGSREHLARFLPWVPSVKVAEDSESTARTLAAKWALREDFVVVVCARTAHGPFAAGEIIGGSGLHRFDWKVRSFEIGYWVRKAGEGKGYIREAVTLLAAMAFRRLGASHVRIHCDPSNVRSAKVPQSLGFTQEARLRCHSLTPEGALRDTLVFGLTREELGLQSWADAAIAAVDAADGEG